MRKNRRLIREFGLFWEREEIDWMPGKGRPFRMLGHRGTNRPGVRVVDFRDQRGLYILYGRYGAYYVGLASDQGIGNRVKDHLNDHHGDAWDRVSWFGFRRTLEKKDAAGLNQLASMKTVASGDTNDVIREMESLLIKALGCPLNVFDTKFPAGREWTQVKREDPKGLLRKVAK